MARRSRSSTPSRAAPAARPLSKPAPAPPTSHAVAHPPPAQPPAVQSSQPGKIKIN